VPHNAGFSFLFLSLHHPNSRFESIYILSFALFNPVAKQLFLARKIGGGEFGDILPLYPKVTPKCLHHTQTLMHSALKHPTLVRFYRSRRYNDFIPYILQGQGFK